LQMIGRKLTKAPPSIATSTLNMLSAEYVEARSEQISTYMILLGCLVDERDGLDKCHNPITLESMK
jgi:hypothetical protein